MMTDSDLNKTFTYHAPHGDQAARYELLCHQAKILAFAINSSCPESREKSLAFTHLQEAIMWANASIALHEANPTEAGG